MRLRSVPGATTVHQRQLFMSGQAHAAWPQARAPSHLPAATQAAKTAVHVCQLPR